MEVFYMLGKYEAPPPSLYWTGYQVEILKKFKKSFFKRLWETKPTVQVKDNDPKTGEELPRLDPSKLQCKAKTKKRKSKQEKDDKISRSKRHRSSTSVKLVEIVELSDSESDVPDDNVGSDVSDDTMEIECDNVEGVSREELGSNIGPRDGNTGNENDGDKSDNVGDKSGNAGVDNVRDKSENENAGVDRQLDNDGLPKGVYVPEFSANADCNIEVEWKAFLDSHQEDIWNSWEDGFGMNNEVDTQPAEEHIPTQDPQPSAVHVDLEMDDMAGQQGNANDTDYGESDKLQSLESHDELGNTTPTRRRYTFNQHS
ncbi:hypothetical protein Adt_35968 [Abeliophyllum distichum]|uniref:Uncharacterized protein n=1 Tax=Abeliophyllum distichum TaxID=126358 RepID=A0ABD1QG98_9LAMI